MPDPAADPIAKLLDEGLLRRDGGRVRTTRRWQAAMARAAFRLLGSGDEGSDLRVPIAHALVELYGVDYPDEDVGRLIEVMLPIEAAEIDPTLPGQTASGPSE